MTKNIEFILQEIEAKILKLNFKLNRQVELNSALLREVEEYKDKNDSLSEQILILNKELSRLELEHENLNMKLVELTNGSKNEEIENLVKEIDQCINQIKDNL